MDLCYCDVFFILQDNIDIAHDKFIFLCPASFSLKKVAS